MAVDVKTLNAPILNKHEFLYFLKERIYNTTFYNDDGNEVYPSKISRSGSNGLELRIELSDGSEFNVTVK